MLVLLLLLAAGRTVECEVAKGRSACGFTYTGEGELLYRGRPLTPAVKVKEPRWFPSFHVSLPPSRRVAAAIARDVDGKSELFVLDPTAGSALAIDVDGGRADAHEVFWSPSGRYLLAWCAYEGEGLVSVDLTTRQWRHTMLPPEGDLIWHLKGSPRWIEGTDDLSFVVEEFCNYYNNYYYYKGCLGAFLTVPDDLRNKALAVRDVRLDAATLRIKSRKAISRGVP